MTEIEYRTVQNDEELRQAQSLAKKNFPHGNSEETKAYKDLLWKKDPSFSFENIFIAKKENAVIGLIRAVPRNFVFANTVFQSACLSSVCVAKEFRGKGVSRPLTNTVDQTLKERGLDFSYLIARKSVDYYYNKFDYYGASSYESMHVKELNRNIKEDTKEVTFSESFSNENIPIYSEAYDLCYSNCWGRTERTKEIWQYTSERINILADTHFKDIQLEGKTIGYFIHDEKNILELAINKLCESESVVSQIVESLEIRDFSLPDTHKMKNELLIHDMRSSSRQCVFGGHMLKTLNEESMITKVSEATNSSIDIKHLNQMNPLQKTLFLAASLGGQGSFNLGFPDQL